MTREWTTLVLTPLPFGSSLLSALSACSHNGVYRAFTCVDHTANPGPIPLALSGALLLHSFCAGGSPPSIRCPWCFNRPRRVLLMGQQVLSGFPLQDNYSRSLVSQIHNVVVHAFGVVAGITLGVDGFLASSPTAHFTPRRRRRGKHQCVGGSPFFSLTQVAIVFALGLERPGCRLGLGFFGYSPQFEVEQGRMEEGAKNQEKCE